jgi:hypothetical protein
MQYEEVKDHFLKRGIIELKEKFVLIKDSVIHEKGVFAKRVFRKGDFVFDTQVGRGQEFFRKVNHSCFPNARLFSPAKGCPHTDLHTKDCYHDELYALRYIGQGWEITIDYRKTRYSYLFEVVKREGCRCRKCRGKNKK